MKLVGISEIFQSYFNCTKSLKKYPYATVHLYNCLHHHQYVFMHLGCQASHGVEGAVGATLEEEDRLGIACNDCITDSLVFFQNAASSDQNPGDIPLD